MVCSRRSRRGEGARRGIGSVRRLDRVEPGFRSRDVLAGTCEAIPLDAGVLALARDLRDAVRLRKDEPPVDDLVLVAVERAHGRAGRPVALLVVLAAVAGAAEAGGERRDQRHLAAALRVLRLLLLVEDGAVRLHRAAEVGAAVRDDREAR